MEGHRVKCHSNMISYTYIMLYQSDWNKECSPPGPPMFGVCLFALCLFITKTLAEKASVTTDSVCQTPVRTLTFSLVIPWYYCISVLVCVVSGVLPWLVCLCLRMRISYYTDTHIYVRTLSTISLSLYFILHLGCKKQSILTLSKCPS